MVSRSKLPMWILASSVAAMSGAALASSPSPAPAGFRGDRTYQLVDEPVSRTVERAPSLSLDYKRRLLRDGGAGSRAMNEPLTSVDLDVHQLRVAGEAYLTFRSAWAVEASPLANIAYDVQSFIVGLETVQQYEATLIDCWISNGSYAPDEVQVYELFYEGNTQYKGSAIEVSVDDGHVVFPVIADDEGVYEYVVKAAEGEESSQIWVEGCEITTLATPPV